ncbi:uncharacterized protein LOC127845495 isoform X3 [Dreissena polymorpha]|uniref:uncharacterized protein LOC127845495 isoform X3 n=1 Tax=Dreissena polymorpha TaxID=45954 RepID=UPI002263BA7F|nr:uncharacterized protein LOC127845495 isoform X3 [Dreissena polymorpha]XP_052232440.1 uncharacterized protein LOC127845495 isoform X3 [Dreissena polymorpha]
MEGTAMPPRTFTPAYMHEEMDRTYEPRPWTTYGKMNEWMNAPGGRDMRTGLPVTRSDGNWRAVDRGAVNKPQKEDFNVRFRDSYADLTNQIAYRFPNPGLPRLRQGRVGGSWRHIKEVLGHGGSRVCYVDGLVAVYDEEQFNQSLAAQSPYRPHLRRQLYSANRGWDEEAARQGREGIHLPAVEELPMMSSNERDRKLAIQSPNKHKGVYSYSRAPV